MDFIFLLKMDEVYISSCVQKNQPFKFCVSKKIILYCPFNGTTENGSMNNMKCAIFLVSSFFVQDQKPKI